MEKIADPSKKKNTRTRKQHTSINFDPHVFDYLEALQRLPQFRRASRSAIVNHVFEEFAELKGTPIIPQED